MLAIYQEAIASQFDAALLTLGHVIDSCSDDLWSKPVFELTFNQVVFHALFFTDLYLGEDVDSLHRQKFHRDHASAFGDYEELKDRRQSGSYHRSFLAAYLEHCREKAKRVIASEDETKLTSRPGFEWLDLSRSEVHVYNLRHVQHHAAQLSLRLRTAGEAGAPWVGRGS